jgi:hypothetical protein
MARPAPLLAEAYQIAVIRLERRKMPADGRD